MNRRDLIQKVLLGGTVLVMVPSVLQSCTKIPASDPQTSPVKSTGTGNTSGNKINIDLTLAENTSLNSAGGSTIVQNILVANTGNGNFIALSSVCTHQGCTVGYVPSTGNIQCPCHGSTFTTSGVVVVGPAGAPLQTYPVTRSGNILTIA